MQQEVLRHLNGSSRGDGIVCWLSPEPDRSELLKAAQRAASQGECACFVVIQYGWGATGFAKSFFLENRAISTLVINLPSDADDEHCGRWVTREIAGASSGFSEVFIDAAGRREEARLQIVQTSSVDAAPLMGRGDVALVSGGGRGISAECGFQLARKTGSVTSAA